jgi:hypothetical protein
MVLAAAVISVAVIVAPAEPQSAAPQPPPPQSAAPDEGAKPYSVEGVRRAFGSRTQPSIDTARVERDRRGYRMAVASSAATSSPCSIVVTACEPTWQPAANPTWHDQMLAMAGPQNYSVPYTGMDNAQRVAAVATSIGFALALQAVASLIHDQVVKSSYGRKQKKVNKVRAEIQGELDELERINALARQSDPAPRKWPQ